MSSVTMSKWQSVLLSTFFMSSLPNYNMFLYLVPVSWLTASMGSMINIQHIALAVAISLRGESLVMFHDMFPYRLNSIFIVDIE